MYNKNISLPAAIMALLFFFSSSVLITSCNQPSRPNREVPVERVNRQTTYCNPVDIDYTYMSHYRAERDVSYRSGADPAIVNFNGKYYLFVTRSHGYWVSEDMGNWRFIRPQN